MDKQLQQRLIGAVVLVSLGVIFIPALLDGSGYKSRHERSIEIPDEPEFAPLTQLEVAKIKTPIEIRKEKKAKTEKAKQQEKQKSHQKSQPGKTIKPAKHTEKIKKKKIEPIHAWALQVGTFSQKANAMVLQDKLRAEKHPAYVFDTKVDGKSAYKVRIGPIIDKKRVEKLKDEIKKSDNLDGYIVSHP